MYIYIEPHVQAQRQTEINAGIHKDNAPGRGKEGGSGWFRSMTRGRGPILAPRLVRGPAFAVTKLYKRVATNPWPFECACILVD